MMTFFEYVCNNFLHVKYGNKLCVSFPLLVGILSKGHPAVWTLEAAEEASHPAPPEGRVLLDGFYIPGDRYALWNRTR